MRILCIQIELNGAMVPVGCIRGNDPGDACFEYFPEYLDRSDSAALSISLPLRGEPFSPSQTASFFEGLLPEGFTRRSVAQWMHADEGDYLSILHGLGRECLGAICVTEGDEESIASYEPISDSQVRELAGEGTSKSVELVTRSHLSLTGASGKAGLYYDREEGRWYLPRGTAPSTHIVKQSHVRLDNIVLNEQLSLLTAAHCGIQTPRNFIINTGKGKEHEILFATERYDRILFPEADRINGLIRPLRLHQEDFAQALGIPASQKYERGTADHLQRMFDLLRRFSADPIKDQLRLWDLIVFHYLIGNTDAHIKNFSLLYGSDLKHIRLAPAYDIISTTIYEQSTRDMAFSIGGAVSIDEIGRDAFRTAAKDAGLGERMALERLDRLQKEFVPALTKSAEELTSQGYTDSEGLKNRILESGGINKPI